MAAKLVLAADTVFRSRNGRIIVHTTSSALPAFETDQPMLAGWICQFARPIDAAAAVSALAPERQAAARQTVEYLAQCGVLVPADADAAQERPAAESAALARNHLRLLARSGYDLACDVLGLGPEHVERALAAKSGIGFERRLLAVLGSLDALRSELLELGRARVAGQFPALGLRPDAAELRLHIGCGKGRLPGWVDIDVDPAPLAMNVLWGLPFRDGSVRRVFVSHLLEHLFYPRDVRFFLGELRRVCAPGAIVRIVVPDIEQCIAAYVADDRSFYASRRETWDWWPKDTTRLQDFLAYAGAGPEPAHLFEAHKYGYDFETLARALGDAGFGDVRRSAYMASEDPELRVDEVSDVAKARYGERYYSLFVEARAPGG